MSVRVAVVLPYFGLGGAETMVARLVSHLPAADTAVFCVYGGPQGNHLERLVLDHGVNITYLGKGLGPSPAAAVRLGKALTNFGPQVVHSHLSACMYAAPWCLLHGVPLVHTVHSVPRVENRRWLRRRVTGYLFRSGRGLPVATSETNRSLVADYYGLAPEAVPVVYNPACPETPRRARRDEDGPVSVITVGRLSAEKNQALLLRAFAQAAQTVPAALTLVGDGPEAPALRALAAELGLTDRVRFAGQRRDVAALLSEADLFVLSSDYEGLPLALLEAMGAGLPILSTAVGGIPDVVTDNGLLTPPGDRDALANAMARLLEDPALRQRMGRRSLDRAAAFAPGSIAAQYGAIYRRCAGTK